AAPPVLALIHDFAEAIGAPPLEVFRHSWSRAEAAYAEANAILRKDVTADLRWMRRSAVGEVLSPGTDVLRQIWNDAGGRFGYDDEAVVETLMKLAALDDARRVLHLSCEFPLLRYGALATIDSGLPASDMAEAGVAERIADQLGETPHVIIVGKKIDNASRRAIEIASALDSATWLFREEKCDTPATRWFVVTPRLASRAAIDEQIVSLDDARPWLESFADSGAHGEYLESGRLPVADKLASVHEPRRSYIAALALLGRRVPREAASAFLATFLFDQPIESLIVEGVTRVEDDCFVFASEGIRAHSAAHIPAPSRAELSRAAASVMSGERAAFLLIDAGDTQKGIDILESVETKTAEDTIDLLSRVPRSALSERLAWRLGSAFAESGRYRDVADLADRLTPEHRELLLAHCDRRSGDYESAMARLDRLTTRSFIADILRCELLRVAGRFGDAVAILNAAEPRDEEEMIRAAYESSLLALESGTRADDSWTNCDHYYSARFLSYRALADADFDSAEALARDALRLARSPVERIDAWMDLVFATFSAGRWSETRTVGLEALTEIEETQGDRAAAGILFTLAYLAADEGHFAAASAALRRLEHYYSSTNDAERLFELKLIASQIHFSRGEFVEARRGAEQTLQREALLPQIREAAALIIDEINTIERRDALLRSTGGSGNRELTDRHRLLARHRGIRSMAPSAAFNCALQAWVEASHLEPPFCSTRSESLKLFRWALITGRSDIARTIASELCLTIAAERRIASAESDVIRIAATSEYPYASEIFGDVQWAFAARNRLGHWIVDGNLQVTSADLDRIASDGEADWIACSDREWLFVGGSADWSQHARQTLAAIFRTRAENYRLKRLLEQEDVATTPLAGLHGMIGESAAIRGVFDTVHRVARRDVAICILGESGTGKELVARAVHRESDRRHKPFVAVNCAALPENLIESELFGHARGAFTGADRDRAGLIEGSDGGTLFLDEIGEMPAAAQAKLLRFLQDGEFRRVGESSNRHSDVRIITATNRRLESAVDEGRFREDLYYRIRGVEVFLPALRERGHDIILLARHFLAAERARHRGGPAGLSSEVESLFRSYRWPGNVRELQNTIRAAHAMGGDAREIAIEHLPERLRSVVPARVMAGSYQDAVAKFRRDLIEKSLLEADGNQNRAAALLNMSRQALAYQIRELGILVRRAPARSV
ncbi:MAG TPA: sigma 54-interacting transcriptional regulator, partial [Thermoanaerobaculia bacterium]